MGSGRRRRTQITDSEGSRNGRYTYSNPIWITVKAKRHGLVIIEPHPRIYANPMLTCTNAVVRIEPNPPFRVLVANFYNFPKRVVHNQTLATVLPHPRVLITTHIRTAEVLAIVQDEGDFPRQEPNLNEKTSLSDSWKEGKRPRATNLDLSHVPVAYREPLGKMLLKYYEMWDGRLGERSVVNDRIDLNPGTKPVIPRPYGTSPSSSHFVSN